MPSLSAQFPSVRTSPVPWLFLVSWLLLLPVSYAVDFVDSVKRTRVDALEAGLPQTALEDWIRSSFKHGAAVTWEVNDCGESEYAWNAVKLICVEAGIPGEDGYSLQISLVSGDSSGSLAGNAELWSIYFYRDRAEQAPDIIAIDSLAEALSEYKRRNNS